MNWWPSVDSPSSFMKYDPCPECAIRAQCFEDHACELWYRFIQGDLAGMRAAAKLPRTPNQRTYRRVFSGIEKETS